MEKRSTEDPYGRARVPDPPPDDAADVLIYKHCSVMVPIVGLVGERNYVRCPYCLYRDHVELHKPVLCEGGKVIEHRERVRIYSEKDAVVEEKRCPLPAGYGPHLHGRCSVCRGWFIFEPAFKPRRLQRPPPWVFWLLLGSSVMSCVLLAGKYGGGAIVTAVPLIVATWRLLSGWPR